MFNSIKNVHALAEFLGVSSDSLIGLSSIKPKIFSERLHQGKTPEGFQYRKMHIPKKNGRKFRVVYKVLDEELKNIQKIICQHLNTYYKPPSSVHGFVPKRNIRTNALAHLSKKNVLNLDIKDFFESISSSSIKKAFSGLGANTRVATILTKLTSIEDRLAQGLSTSPVLANIIFEPIDNAVLDLCNKFETTYTRYGDDMTISSNGDLPPVTEIEKLFKGKFSLNKSKTKLMSRGSKQFVTGLTIFDDKYPRVPKKIKRLLRLHLYYMQKYGIAEHLMKVNAQFNKIKFIHKHPEGFIAHIRGWIDYVNAIEPELAKKYYSSFNNARASLAEDFLILQ